jgi:hypothetical protein
VRDEVREFIDRTGRYKAKRPLLWQLHELDIIDKHRMLITAGTRWSAIRQLQT